MASAAFTVKIKWGKETLENVEVSAAEGLEVFKAQLFALTSVPTERQKILIKGKQLKEDADLQKLKQGDLLMLMGSAEAVADGPAKPVVFEEDLTDAQRSQLAVNVYPCGLTNLGNTCYMNSGLQCMRSFPELHSALKSYGRTAAAASASQHDQAHVLAMGMRTLFDEMERSSSEKPVTPMLVLSQVRAAFPQFAERGRNGGYAQQDADEFYSQVMQQVLTKVKDISVPLNGVSDKQIRCQELFEGQFDQITTCAESDAIVPQRASTPFTVLKCYIDKEKSLLHECLRESMVQSMEKRAPELGRNAQFVAKSAISRLPHYLTIQFVRFFWKNRDGGAGVKTKILKKITFPLQLDMYEFCSDDLKQSLKVHRDAKVKADEDALGLHKKSKAAAAAAAASGNASSMDIVASAAAAAEEKKEDEAVVAALPKGNNPSGRYELVAMVTHQGRDADGGHYVGWARSNKAGAAGVWHKFDDDTVTPVDEAAILALQGGGDWPMGYICFYRHVLE